jgi:WD40 repeat protein/mono/diheme cytochrome c family protein
MSRPYWSFFLWLGLVLLAGREARMGRADDKPAAGPVSFYKQVRPIFQENCQGCHQPAMAGGGFVITHVARILKGGESGDPGVVPGKPDEGALVSQITPEDGKPPAMPKDRTPLAAPQIELVRRWIQEGAHDDTPAAANVLVDMDHPPDYTAPPVLTSLRFSPDGSLLAVSGYHEVLLYKADGSELVARLVGLSERIESAVFSPDGKRLAVTGGSPCRMGEVQIWNLRSHKLAVSHPVTYDTVYGASWSGDGKLVAFGCSDNSVRVIEARSGKQVLFQGAHSDLVVGTVFSTTSTHLVSISRDGSMKLIEVATERFIDNITSITPSLLKGGLMALTRHPSKDELLAGGADGVPEIYKMFRTQARQIGDDFNLIRKFDALPGRVFAVCYNADGSRIAAVSSLDGHGEARVYQAGDGKLVSKFELSSCGLYAIGYRPDGKALAVGGFDGMVRLIDPETGKPIREFLVVPSGAAKVASK